MSSPTTAPTDLAGLLRKSAEIVERKEFHPLLYQTMRGLTAYAAEYADGGISNGSNQPRTAAKSAFADVPDAVLDGSSIASGGRSVASLRGSKTTAFSLKGIKKGLEKIGAELFVADGINNNTNNNNNINGKEDSLNEDYSWCDEHFIRGCACKTKARPNSVEPQQTQQQVTQPAASAATVEPDRQQTLRPCFQRPINPSSNLIANGWIDQQRRSKMRVVWKDVLASLVEGRRPGEETTLWIQRQVIDPATGKVTGLEALHQVPMKWLEDVNYVDIYGDHRFTLKVYNIAEEFYFRTRDEQSAQSWVLTLRSARDASLENCRMGGGSTSKPSAKDVGGMGLHNLEDWDAGKQQTAGGNEMSDAHQTAPAQSHSRMTISDLRALAHGAGYDTRGMERQDLEKIAAIVRGQSSAPSSAPSVAKATLDARREKEQQEARAQEEDALRRKDNEERLAAENLIRQKEEAEKRKVAAEQLAVEQRRREDEQTRKRMEEHEAAEMRKRQDDERQRQVEQQAAEIKRRQEEERRKRVAELQAAEAKRCQEEENRRQQQQQQQQTNYNSDSSGGYRNHQQQYNYQQHPQYQQKQPPQTQNQQFHNQNIPNAAAAGYPPQGFHGQQQQRAQNQQYQGQNGPFTGTGFPQKANQGHTQPPPPQQQRQHNPPQGNGVHGASAKYMEEKSDELQSAATLRIKRCILINWALLPPNLNVLRPIDQLITTIHTAMPPAYGIPSHEYFSKFTPISRNELIASAAMGNHPDETKLKKAVRRVRVFLHPDKLPRDLSADQQFMARMLWDITSDSWEEFAKHKDELDWIRS